MTIRNAAKAVIIENGCLLLQRCGTPDGTLYYELPGGGQNPFETMEEAVVREVLEETGYTVSVERFLALQEEMFMNAAVRERYELHAHRMLHIFLCHLTAAPRQEPTEIDNQQLAIEWVPLEALGNLLIRPQIIGRRLGEILKSGTIGYMPANRIREFFE